jgi:PAS domain S-box-containing protein
MNESLTLLAEQYAAALEDYVAADGDAALHSAYELGRMAITEGVGLLELLTIHQRILTSLLAESQARGEALEITERASAFLAESLSLFEMVLRGFHDTNASLRANLEQIQAAERELHRQNQQLFRANESVEAERRRYEELFDFAPNAYLVTDVNGTIQEANTTAESLLQTSRAILVGRRLASFVSEEERPAFQSQLAKLGNSETERLEFYRINLAIPGGSIPVSVLVAAVRDSEDRLTGLRCLLRDITEQQRMEEERAQLRIREHLVQAKSEAAQRLQILAEVSTALVGSLDYASIPGSIAQLAVPCFGDACVVYLTDENARPCHVAFSRTDPERPGAARSVPLQSVPAETPNVVAEALEQGKLQALDNVPTNWLGNLVPDLTEGPVGNGEGDSALVVPLVAHGSALGAIVVVSGDGKRYGTEERGMTEELARRCALALENARLYQQVVVERDKAEKASRAKEEFVAVLSHELRTPLTAILGWSRLLKRQSQAADGIVADGVLSLEHNAQTLSRLVEDCLDVTRISEGKVQLQKRTLDVNDVARAAMDATHEIAVSRNVQSSIRVTDAPLYVAADQTRLEQVILNLLTNAFRYTPSGGEVRLSIRQAGNEAEVEVRDTGIGIEPQALERIFQPFHQSAENWYASESGLGLGLAIARDLVGMHGGRIWAESLGRGHGSTFRVRLPLVAAPVAEAKPTVAHSLVPEIAKPLRILFVEDSKDVLALFRIELEDLGYTVFTATDGEAGLEIARRELPAVIISDIKMPRYDGYQFIQQIRRDPRLAAVPAIALTGFGAKKDADEVLRAGYNAHVCKPVELQDLVSLIQQLA